MRIWVTGIGIVSPLAPASRATMDCLCRGESAFRQVTLFDASDQRTQRAAEVPDLRVDDVVPDIPGVTWSRADAMAIAAAREAMSEAELDGVTEAVDLVVGTTTGATYETELDLPELLEDASAEKLTTAIAHPLALTVDNVALALGTIRRRRLISSACSTGANALLLAAAWIRSGRSDRVVAGASDSLCRLTFTGFNALASLDPDPCRPFDATRAGLGLGEGAAFLVLERDDCAQQRGVEPIAELVGWSAGAEAHHITNPEADGTIASRIMSRALASGGLAPSDVDYVNAHGTATKLNDPMEIRAVRRALGSEFDRVAISSIKGQIGHSLGAAGAVEAAVTALCVGQGRVPPTGGLTVPADDCDANHVIGSQRDLPLRVAMSNSFGFGGLDGVIVLAKPGYAPLSRALKPSTIWVRGAAVARDAVVRAATGQIAGNPPQGPLSDEVTASLDRNKGRRLGRPERLMTAVIAEVLPGAAGHQSTGVVVGKPSGNPDATSRFLDRVRKRGPRMASPAEFPNLMLSSLAGHVSIYHGLEGLSLTTSSRHGAGGACLLTACELLDAGIPDRLVVGAVDPWGLIAQATPGRVEGAAAVVLDPTGTAESAVARISLVAEGTSCSTADLVDRLPQAPVRPGVVVSGFDPVALADTPWGNAPVVDAVARFGRQDAIALCAVVLAVSHLADRAVDRVLVCVCEGDVTALFLLDPP